MLCGFKRRVIIYLFVFVYIACFLLRIILADFIHNSIFGRLNLARRVLRIYKKIKDIMIKPRGYGFLLRF